MRIHITNGESGGRLIQRVAGDGEPIVPWRDLLHEGPVPGGLDLPSLSAVRAAFVAGCGWGELPELLGRFRDRDACLERAAAEPESLTLWFEHDLYDQLQLLQVLDLVRARPGLAARAGLVQADRYLGALTVAEVAALRSAERPVTAAQLELAGRAWAAFTAPTPEALAALLGAELGALPYLRPALLRLLAELPAPATGLARTELLALRALEAAGGPLGPGHLFGEVQALESAVFMGDWPFFRWLQRLGCGAVPLVEGVPPTGLEPRPGGGGHAGPEARGLRLTEAGRRVLAGGADWLDLHVLDRWVGGTHLRAGRAWRWDGERLRGG